MYMHDVSVWIFKLCQKIIQPGCLFGAMKLSTLNLHACANTYLSAKFVDEIGKHIIFEHLHA
jgi:hypothetical protein